MLQTVTRLFPEVPLIVMTAITTHLIVLFAQTQMVEPNIIPDNG
jgi:hypothetical protein